MASTDGKSASGTRWQTIEQSSETWGAQNWALIHSSTNLQTDVSLTIMWKNPERQRSIFVFRILLAKPGTAWKVNDWHCYPRSRRGILIKLLKRRWLRPLHTGGRKSSKKSSWSPSSKALFTVAEEWYASQTVSNDNVKEFLQNSISIWESLSFCVKCNHGTGNNF